MSRIKQLNHKSLWLILGIMFIAANLRAPITSVGVVVPTLREALHLSTTAISILSILPLLIFVIVSLIAAQLSHRFGLERTLFFALMCIFIGIIVRSIAGVPFLFIGTVFIGIGIGLGNVLTPGLIKSSFPLQIGLMTGIYTVLMNIFGAISSLATGPIAKASNYNIALGLMGVVTFITLLIWFRQLFGRSKKTGTFDDIKYNVWKSPLSWQITILMGAQSLIFYSLINWLPEMLLDSGISVEISGLYLTIMQIAIIPVTFIVPVFAAKMKSQFMITLFAGVLFIISTIGMIVFDAKFILIFIILLGIAGGFAFGLVNTFFSLRTETGMVAAKLSGMAQSIGYIFAAFGPFLIGMIHDATNSWNIALLTMVVTSFIITIFASGAGRNKTIEETLRK